MYSITSYYFIDKKLPITLLFLHGWGCNFQYMLPIAKSVSNANALVIDLPGFGDNESFLTPKSINQFVEIILYFLNENHFKIDGIIGHSFGGKLAVLLANSLNVHFLLLFAPSIYNSRRSFLYYLKVFTYKIIKKIKFLKRLLPYFGSKDYRALNPVMKKTMSNVINENITNELKALTIPILLIFGKKDKITPLYLSRKIIKNAKDASLIRVEGDHFAYLYNVGLITKMIESMVNSTC